MALRFHWMLPKAGEVVAGAQQTPLAAARYRIESTRPDSRAPIPEMEGWTCFAEAAERAGIDSVLDSISRTSTDCESDMKCSTAPELRTAACSWSAFRLTLNLSQVITCHQRPGNG